MAKNKGEQKDAGKKTTKSPAPHALKASSSKRPSSSPALKSEPSSSTGEKGKGKAGAKTTYLVQYTESAARTEIEVYDYQDRDIDIVAGLAIQAIFDHLQLYGVLANDLGVRFLVSSMPQPASSIGDEFRLDAKIGPPIFIPNPLIVVYHINGESPVMGRIESGKEEHGFIKSVGLKIAKHCTFAFPFVFRPTF